MKVPTRRREPVMLTRITTLPRSEKASASMDAGRLRSCILNYLIGSEKRAASPDLRLFGWLKRSAYQHTQVPVGDLTNPDRARLAGSLWNGKVASLDSEPLAYKMSSLLNPKFEAALLERKLPVEEVIIKLVSRILLVLQEKFYSGDELGFLITVRTDKKAPEARVLVFPQTAGGKGLDFAGPVKASLSDGSTIWVDFQTLIRDTLFEIGLEFERDEIKIPPFSERFPYRAAQEMLLTNAAYKMAEGELNNENPGAEPTKEVLRARAVLCRERLLLKKNSELRELLENAYTAELSSWEAMSLDWAKQRAAGAAAGKSERAIALQQIARTSPPEYEAEIQARAERRSVRRECFRANSLYLGWQTFRWGHDAFWNDSGSGWWQDRMLQNDPLGAIMRDIGENPKRSGRRVSRASSHFKRLRNLRSFEPLQMRLSRINELFDSRHAEGQKACGRLETAKFFAAKQLGLSRVRLHTLNLGGVTAAARVAGVLPTYLSDYSAWKKEGRAIPLALNNEQKAKNALRQERLTARDRAILNSAPATDIDYKLMKAEPPPLTDDQKSQVGIAIHKVHSPRIKSARNVAAATPPAQILTEADDILGTSLSHHGNAIQQLLEAPSHQMFKRNTAFPLLDATEPKSFAGLLI